MFKLWQRSLSMLLAFVMVLGIMPIPAFANEVPENPDVQVLQAEEQLQEPTDDPDESIPETSEPLQPLTLDGGFTYIILQDGTCQITGYTGSETELIIPDEIDGLAVTQIAKDAFASTSITSVEIPEGVTTLGIYSFYNCRSLERVTLPQSLVTIGNYAFYGCRMLEEITLPSSLETLGSYAFFNCDALTQIDIPSGITKLGTSTFSSCDNLTSVTLPDTLTKIGEEAFSSCYALAEINLPESLQTLGQEAFYSCDALTEIVIPAGITTIPYNAFYDCDSLASVTFSEGLTAIGINAFYRCKALTNLEFPSSLSLISASAFCDCDALVQITIPEGITTIGSNAFQNCDSLEEIILPDSLTTIESHAFSYCGALSRITLPDQLKNIGFSAFAGCNALTAFTIPSGVTAIESSLFMDCKNLETVELHDGIISMGTSVFSGCTALKEIRLPESLKTLGASAFSNCHSLTQITIPEGITTLDYYTFSYCKNLVSVDLPESLTKISYYAFNNCTALTDISLPENLKVLEYNAFYACKSLTEISIPESVTTIANSLFYQCEKLEKVNLHNQITEIGSSAFYGCTALESIVTPENLTKIGSYAFGQCTSLADFTLPAGLTALESSAFYGCKSLRALTIPAGITTVADDLFRECSSLTTVNLHSNITAIGRQAFSGCSNLKNIELPARLEKLGYSAFSECDAITQITIPAGVTVIEPYTFSNCDKLARVNLHDQIHTIGASAFYYCTSLTEVQIPSLVTEIPSQTFMGCQKLTRVLLPEDLVSLGNNAFMNCSSLNDINLPSDLTSLGSYTFTNCKSLTDIVIPDALTEISYGVFSGCTSLASVMIHADVTSIANNAFTSCDNLTFVTLPDCYAWEYAQKNGINVIDLNDGMRVLQLTVKNEAGETLTEGFTVNWYKAGEQTSIATGTLLRGMESGIYEYELILDDALRTDYIQPKRTALDYQGDILQVELILDSIVAVEVCGIISSADGTPISDATLSFTQVFGTQEKQYSAKTASDGTFSISLPSVQTTGILSADGYYSREMSMDLSAVTDSYTYDATLNPLPSNQIKLKLLLKQAGAASFISMSGDSNNLAFRLENLTKGTQIEDVVFQNGTLIIADGEVSAHDTIRITATDSRGQMTAQSVCVTLDGQKTASAEISFLENGKFTLTKLTGCDEKLLMVFDDAGTFLYSTAAASGYTSSALTAGEYTIVLIQKTALLRSVSSLSDLVAYGLTAGTDFVQKKITIENGILTNCSSIFVPVLDQSKLSCTVADGTSFTVNKPVAFAGEYLSLRVAYEIDPNHPSSNQQVRIHLPAELSMAVGSLTLDGKKQIYSLDNNILTVNTNRSKGIIRFYVSAPSVGDYQIQSELCFASGSDNLIQPLGSVNIDVVAAQLNLPDKTTGGIVTVTGKSIPNSTITFYDTGVEIGSTEVNDAGSFQAQFVLKFAGKYTHHEISALVSNDQFDAPLAVESKIITNDESYIQLSKITMINIAHSGQGLERVEYVSEFNFLNPGPPPNYWFWPGCYPEFTFIVEFVGNGASKVKNVNVVTLPNYGEETVIPCFYDEANNRWLATQNYNSAADAPWGVTATYDIIQDENAVAELDQELYDAYMEEVENAIGPKEEPLPDWDEVMAEVEADPDDEFTQEDAEEFQRLSQEAAVLKEEINKLLEEIYYEEQTAWAEQGYAFTREGDTQILESENGKLEITSRELFDVTPEQLLEDGYILSGKSEELSVYERTQNDGTQDRVVFMQSSDGTSTDVNFTSTKFTPSQSDEEGTPPPAFETLMNDVSDLGDRFEDADNVITAVAGIAELKGNRLQEFADSLATLGKNFKALHPNVDDLTDPDSIAIKKALDDLDDLYADVALNKKNMDGMKELADMSSSALKPYTDVLDAVDIAATVNEYISFHVSLRQIGDFLPENCDSDKDNFNYAKFKLTMANLDAVANDIAYAEFQIVDKLLEATGIGILPALGVGLLTDAVTELNTKAMRSDIDEIKEMALNLDCNGDGIPDGDPSGKLNNLGVGFLFATTVIDPSGYVYEAVPSNRVEGVKAEAYYLGYALDEYGIPKDEPEDIFWEAESYDQVNPVYTNELGMFHWDVPMGQWLVKFSKEGYYDTDTRSDPAADEDGYLPVPPPQVEVNTAIVSKAAPMVEAVNIYNDQIQIIFSQYMQLDTVNTNHITVSCGGKQVSGTIAPVNAEYNYEKTTQYASIFTFTPSTKLDGTATVTVGNCVNYAGTAMEKTFTVTDAVKFRPEQIFAVNSLAVGWNDSRELSLQILPVKAGANQTITLQLTSSSILGVSVQKVTTDEQGRATVQLSGLLPGTCDVIAKLEGTDITAQITVSVTQKAAQIPSCEKVTANLPSGSVVEPGTKLILETATEGAEIYYTLDGTCPCIVNSPSRIRYTGPITLYEDAFLIAYAVKAGMEDSATAGFMYSVREAACAHSATKLINRKDATCTTTGYTGDKVCSSCGETVEKGSQIQKKAHTEVIDKAVAATCTQTGLTEGKHCSICSTVLVKQETVKAKGHTEVIDKAVAATCTKTGLTEGKHCSVCSTVLVKQETVKAKGHKWSEWKETKPATGSAEGEEKRTCSVCKKEEKRAIPKLENPFTDVPGNMYYLEPVLWAVSKGITTGTEPGKFEPEESCTRGQIVTFLWRAAGKPQPESGKNPFVDVKRDMYYYDAVLWAVEKGITTGTDAKHFSPDEVCTRGQVATFLWRYLKEPKPASGKNPFKDVPKNMYYYNPVLWAVEAGVTNGTDPGKFSPEDSCTRGQIVTFLYRALEN